jgi:DNA-binding transcriptional LysR family regulator
LQPLHEAGYGWPVAASDERLFLRVVEAGSIKAAAAQLGSDPSTVSRQLAALEARLGVKLLQRSTKRTLPTEAGARYFDGLRRLVDLQDALEAELAGTLEVPRGRLRVTAPVDFGARFVVPVLDELQRASPELEVDLLLGSGFVEIVEAGIDVAVRIGRLADSSLVARKLGVVPRVLVAAPSYLGERGTPRTVAELEEHDFVLYAPSTRDRPLELTGPRGATASVHVRGRFIVNSVNCVRDLVEAGRGLHLGPRWAFADALAHGRVVEVLRGWGVAPYPLHAVFAPTQYVPAKIRAFVEAMGRHFAAHGG